MTITLQLVRCGHPTPLYRVGYELDRCMKNEKSFIKVFFATYLLVIFVFGKFYLAYNFFKKKIINNYKQLCKYHHPKKEMDPRSIIAIIFLV